MANPRKFGVLVADGEPLARTGLVHLINSHSQLRVCGETETLTQARELCSQLQPRLLVLDPALGEPCSFIKDLPRWSGATRVVLLSRQYDALSVQRAFKAGAFAYITRGDPIAAVMSALLLALDGRRFAGPQADAALLENLACGAVEFRDSEPAVLSDREFQVYRLIGRGLATREIAEQLHVSVKTVETHQQRIKRKLCVATGRELKRRAAVFCEDEASFS